MNPRLFPIVLAALCLLTGSMTGCGTPGPSTDDGSASRSSDTPRSAAAGDEPGKESRMEPRSESGGESDPAAPPPAIAAWMERLTVPHAYDPETGFIVARETISLPPLLADAPPLDVAVAEAGPDRLVVVFATADRCAPCQQFKKDALNNAEVVAHLGRPRFLPTHIEVDREPELAEQVLGSRGIPMTYALRNGVVVATLRGQRSAPDLLAWLDALP